VLQAAQQFGVSDSTVREWVQRKQHGIPLTDQRAHSGSHALLDRDEERLIVDYIQQHAAIRTSLSPSALLAWVRQRFAGRGAFTSSWFRGFAHRWTADVRTLHHSPSSVSPARATELVQKFWQTVDALHETHKYASIYNMDEASVLVDAHPRQFVRLVGSDAKIVCTSKHRTYVTLVMCTNCNGGLVRSGVIFLGKQQQRTPPHNNIWVRFQPSAWMDGNIMCHWIEDVLVRDASFAAPCLLYVDAFAAHVTEAVMRVAAKHDITIVVVPASCTKYVQPTTVRIVP